jgi:hypothetical protein
MLRDFGNLLDHSWYHFPDMHVISIPDSLRNPIIQHQASSLTRTLTCRETKSYLPLNKGETGTTWVRTERSVRLFIQPAHQWFRRIGRIICTGPLSIYKERGQTPVYRDPKLDSGVGPIVSSWVHNNISNSHNLSFTASCLLSVRKRLGGRFWVLLLQD